MCVVGRWVFVRAYTCDCGFQWNPEASDPLELETTGAAGNQNARAVLTQPLNHLPTLLATLTGFVKV